jgi:hypothetical protein
VTGLKDYSTTPGDNDIYFPENMPASDVNDNARQFMADTREWFEDSEWINYGDTPTRTGNTTFTVSGDLTSRYATGRRIRCADSGTIYGTIVSSSYSAPNTTVTIHSDSGNLSASLSAVSLGSQYPINSALHANLGRKGSDIASASTVDLSGATGDFVDITGTTTITAFGTMAAGVERVVRFTGALTLTHNGTSLILPGAANITTANGDIAILRSLGSGNWVCVNYAKVSGNSLTMRKGADIASATTTDLSTATGQFVDVTGTTTITGLGTADAGIQRLVRFTGALTLTHNGTSLILPGAANITTADGDAALFVSLGSGNWKCLFYMKADGTAVVATTAPFSDANAIIKNASDATKLFAMDASGISASTTRTWTLPDTDISFFYVNHSYTETGAYASGTTTIPSDDTIPQNTEGDEYMTLSHTPKNSNNILVIDVVGQFSHSTSGQFGVALFKDSDASAIATAGCDGSATTNRLNTVTFRHRRTAGTTSAITFKVRAGNSSSGTTHFNGAVGVRNYGGSRASSITVWEFSA